MSRRLDFLENGLALIGLLLVGAAVYLTWDVAATLGYAGAACMVLAAVLAFVPRSGEG